ncbi:MAG: hypothetical protein ACK4N5_25405, partial [Myxococcales bacterium]
MRTTFLKSVPLVVLLFLAACGNDPPPVDPCGGCPAGETCQNGKCTGSCASTETKCGDGADDDCDGKVDCADPDCTGSTACQTAGTCTDGQKNGSETDVDCGGTCPACDIGKTCGARKDCKSGNCHSTQKVCAEPSCTDGSKNGNETDID